MGNNVVVPDRQSFETMEQVRLDATVQTILQQGNVNFKDNVTTISDLPSTGNTLNDFRMVIENGWVYKWNGSSWVQVAVSGGGGGVQSVTGGTGISVTGTATDPIINSTITQYTDEMAQDAVGSIVANTDTINITYNDGTPNIVADARVQMSITSDTSGLKLLGDLATPGANKTYGTLNNGVRAWKDTAITIGDLVVNGGIDDVLFVGSPSQQLDQDSDFTRSKAAKRLILSNFGDKTLYINPVNGEFKIGNMDGGNRVHTYWDDTNNRIDNILNGNYRIQAYPLGTYNIADFNTSGKIIRLGNVSGAGNNTLLTINDTTELVSTVTDGSFDIRTFTGNDKYLQIDMPNKIVWLGDIDNAGTNIKIDVISDEIESKALHHNYQGLQDFPDNASAILGGLNVGDLYYTNTAGEATVKIVI